MKARSRKPGRTPGARSGGWATATVSALAAYNVLSNRVFPAPLYVPANLAMSLALLELGRRAGLTWAELGWGRERLGRGLRWGLGAGSFVAASVLALAGRSETRPLFRDGRVSPRSAVAAYEVLVRIPLGTAFFEETAFRGVLPGILGGRRGRTVVSSLLFGLWHILPTIDTFGRSPLIDRGRKRMGSVGSVAAVVGVTMVAGYGFSWLRHRSGSLVAPILAHAATNSLGYAASYGLFRGVGR